MANRPNNIWAKAAAGSPGTNIARAQQSRWTGIPNEAIMRLVEDKIGGMLEGISDATERNAAAQMQLDLQKKLQAAAAKYGSLSKEDFRLEMVKLAVEAVASRPRPREGGKAGSDGARRCGCCPTHKGGQMPAVVLAPNGQ